MTDPNTLSDTLTALVLGATPQHPRLVVEEAEINLSLLVRLARGPHGEPVLTAQLPYSPYRQGIEPVVHRARLSIEQVTEQAVTPETDPAPKLVE